MTSRLAPLACVLFMASWGASDLFGQGPGAKPLDPLKVRAEAAKWIRIRWERETYAGRGNIWGVYLWSRRQAVADMDTADGPAERLTAAESHLSRMRFTRNYIRTGVASGHQSLGEFLLTEYFVADAEVLVSEAKCIPERTSIDPDAALARLVACELIFRESWDSQAGQPGRSLWGFTIDFAQRRLEAKLAVARDRHERLAAAENFRGWTHEYEKYAHGRAKAGRIPSWYATRAAYLRRDAEILVERFRSDAKKPPVPAEPAKARLNAAAAVFEAIWGEFRSGQGNVEDVYQGSDDWRRAAEAVASSHQERQAAIRAHQVRLRELRYMIGERVFAGRVPYWQYLAAHFFSAEADILLKRAKQEEEWSRMTGREEDP
jgi:hypothetical protein